MKYLLLLILTGCATPVCRPTENKPAKSDEQIAKEREYIPFRSSK